MKFYEIDNKTTKGPPEQFEVRYCPEVPLEAINGRVVRNPNYNDTDCGIHGWCAHPKVSHQRKPCFMAALGESLKKEGYRNPVVLYSTPTGLWMSFGGSRIQAGRDAGLTHCKAIINDYTGEYSHCTLVTEANWSSFFTDVPRWHEFGETGFDYHYSLERNRRDTYDPAGFEWVGDFDEIRHEFSWVKE
jgi:hypothetical protein